MGNFVCCPWLYAKRKYLMRRIYRTKIGFLLIGFVSFTLVVNSCNENQETPLPEKKILTVFYTNDEHGWMEPFDDLAGGASGMLGRWKEVEGYDGKDSFLVLSGGDMWTGPAISSWFKGESMVNVMNAMGYDAAAIGNHEFDFTVEVLTNNMSKMNFPLLSANIKEKNSGNIPSFAKPYLITKSGLNLIIIQRVPLIYQILSVKECFHCGMIMRN